MLDAEVLRARARLRPRALSPDQPTERVVRVEDEPGPGRAGDADDSLGVA